MEPRGSTAVEQGPGRVKKASCGTNPYESKDRKGVMGLPYTPFQPFHSDEVHEEDATTQERDELSSNRFPGT